MATLPTPPSGSVRSLPGRAPTTPSGSKSKTSPVSKQKLFAKKVLERRADKRGFASLKGKEKSSSNRLVPHGPVSGNQEALKRRMANKSQIGTSKTVGKTKNGDTFSITRGPMKDLPGGFKPSGGNDLANKIRLLSAARNTSSSRIK